jgi:GT2 family glycosyltransferase
MPTRNRWPCLQKVLASYCEQPEVKEVILVDDGGDIPAPAGLAGRSGEVEVRIERVPERRGAPHARNLGTRVATGEWILYSDDDVYLEPDYVARLLASQARTSAGLLAGRRIYLLDGESEADARERCARMRPEPFIPRYVEANFSAPVAADREVLHLQTTAMVRRDLALQVGWDESIFPTSYREETDFCLRVLETGVKLIWVGGATCYHLAPAETAVGGQRANRWWRYELGSIRNNHRFLNRHYRLLSERGGIEGPRWLAELRFIDRGLRGGALRALYRSYYHSPLRPPLRRILARD